MNNLSNFKPIEPPKELFNNITERLKKEQNFFALKLRLAIFSICLTISLVAFAPVLKMLYVDFSQSGFIKFLSLIFSDFEIIKIYWQNFIFVLLETLPIFSLLLFFGTIFVIFESIYILFFDFKIIINRHKLIN
ncbi:hypothetical protein JW977_01480 [Candidatus Falkowbacteria bacterium]|nr:hypothetical protein [Candidatus Falkowbacteria bacterium]